MPFYEYEYTLYYYNEILKERKDDEGKKHKEYEDKYNIKDMQSSLKRNTPSPSSFKIPKMPGM